MEVLYVSWVLLLWYGKPTGILVTLFVFIMYKIALLFEEPFTAKIYANRQKLD